MNTTGEEHGHALDQALAWIARLRADTAAEADRQAFALWLAAAPSHPQAMDDALALWEELGDAVAVEPPPGTGSDTSRSRRWLFGSAAAIAASALLALFLGPLAQHEPQAQIYTSALGERQEVALPDGSRALLNSNTRISVTYSDDQRQIVLRRGRAADQHTDNTHGRRTPGRPSPHRQSPSIAAWCGTPYLIGRL